MSSPLLITLQVTFTGLALAGFTSNAFIIAVIIIGWAKSRTLNSSELLLLSLGMSNICFTASLSAFAFFTQFQSNFRNLLMFRALYTFLNFAFLSRFWFTAWLCVFYCIKIVNSTHSLFLWCKQRISWLLPWLLAASAAISIIASVFALQLVPVRLQSNTTTVNITDMSKEVLEITTAIPSNRYTTFFIVIGSSCPLLVVLLCSIVIVASLYRHMFQMTRKESSFRSPQTEAHFGAARTVLFLLFLYLSFYVAQILLMTKGENEIIVCGCFMVMMGYSFAQAAILVLGNPKLKQAVPQLLPGRKP